MQYGYFDDDNREYVIERPDVPVSWTNYLGVTNTCAVISHNAGGYMFHRSPEHHRITRFRQNGVPLDRPGHYVYLRDDATGEYWSISWQPVGRDLSAAHYQCRHGLSYSTFLCETAGVRARQTLFIPVNDEVEIWDVRIENTSGRNRTISLFSYVEFSFHHIAIDNQNLQMSLYAAGTNFADGIIEYDFFYEPAMYHFFAASFVPDSYDCVRDRFLGPYRTESNPAAVERGECHNSTELGGNHCASLHKRLTLRPGEQTRLVFLLGVGSREQKGRTARDYYSNFANVDAAFAALKAYWEAKRSILQVDTPHPGMNSMINTWTLYQVETCVVWSRFASFIEVGGRTGVGYRDTSQDLMSVVHSNPRKAQQRMIELLRAQVGQGYGLHLFEPTSFADQPVRSQAVLPTVVPTPPPEPLIHGIKDACSDDALWLVVAIGEFVKETGDLAFLGERVPFADGGDATVYDHAKKALDFSATHVGPNGICQGLRADWNDCLNLGRGESSMVSFLLYWALQAFLDMARHLGRAQDLTAYQRLAAKIRQSCEQVLWDGQWYLRGITTGGARIGARDSEQGKLYLNAQSWAVYSNVASQERGRTCMDAVDQHLYSEYGLHLLWPAYTEPDDEIGFITRVYPGIKENGAIFSHANPWAIIAECILGRGDRALKYYDAILPYRQNDLIEIREAEPYSYCQFVMGRDHSAFGRARHPWLTGSAGWFYTAATRWILGIRPDYDGLVIDPCIPRHWPGFRVARTWRGARFHIIVANPRGVSKGVQSISLDGVPVREVIPPQKPGSTHEVVVTLGEPGADAPT